MRRIKFVALLSFLALVAFLLGPRQGQSQPPRGGWGGRDGGGSGGFGGRDSGSSGGMMRGGFDPERMFEMMSQGKGTIQISEMRMGREQAEDWARKNGISNGQLTKEQFLAYSETSMDRMAEESFARRANGGNTVRITDMRDPAATEQWAREKGITGGVLTREQYLEYFRQSMGIRRRDAGTASAPASGSPTPGSPAPAPATSGNGGDSGRGWGRGGWGDRTPSDNDVARMAEERFRWSDRNQDGFLAFEEMSESLQAEKDKWDANKDGQIELSEYKEYLKAWMEKRQAERRERDQQGSSGSSSSESRGNLPPGSSGGEEQPSVDLDRKVFVLRAGKLGDRMPSWFTEHDLDGDAQVALYEWKEKGSKTSEFRERDLNGDGFITAEEALRGSALAKASNSSSGGTGRSGGNGSSGSSQDNRVVSAGGAPGQGQTRPGGWLGAMFGRRGGQQGGPGNSQGGSQGGAPGGGGPGGGMWGMGGGGSGGSGGRFDFNNPETVFQMVARGRTSFPPSDSQRYGTALTEFLAKKGVRDNQVTLELFKEFWAQRSSTSGNERGPGGMGGTPSRGGNFRRGGR